MVLWIKFWISWRYMCLNHQSIVGMLLLLQLDAKHFSVTCRSTRVYTRSIFSVTCLPRGIYAFVEPFYAFRRMGSLQPSLALTGDCVRVRMVAIETLWAINMTIDSVHMTSTSLLRSLRLIVNMRGRNKKVFKRVVRYLYRWDICININLKSDFNP